MKKEANLKKELRVREHEETQRVKDIAELKKAVNALRRDAKSQSRTISRLKNNIRTMDSMITQLRSKLSKGS